MNVKKVELLDEMSVAVVKPFGENSEDAVAKQHLKIMGIGIVCSNEQMGNGGETLSGAS